MQSRVIIFVMLTFCSNLHCTSTSVDAAAKQAIVAQSDSTSQGRFWNAWQKWVTEPINIWVVSPVRTASSMSFEFFKPYFMKTWEYVVQKSRPVKQKFVEWLPWKRQPQKYSFMHDLLTNVPSQYEHPRPISTESTVSPAAPAAVALPKPNISATIGLEPFSGKRIDLHDFAEGHGYGYKTANLMQLKELVKNIHWIEIPDFVAVSSQAMQAFLAAHGINIAARWTAVCEGVDQAEVRRSRKFPTEFLAKLSVLEKEIKAKFEELADKITEEQFLQLFDPKVFPKAKELISQENIRLMVRSTGREDTDDVANAGGNESVKNVAPDIKEIMHAKGIVVASYFSAKSFGQRLIAGDPKLFDLMLTPVLIQKMIGEVVGQPITSAGVMYTEEAEGGWARIRQANPGFKETTGITVIQATYGHNEAVVNGLVPIDTFYISADYTIHSVVKHKHARIVPAHDTPVPNPAKIADKPALSADVIHKLKSIAIKLEKFYGKPMDVEFVYHPETIKISIVQARPITYKKDLLPPCFLKDIDDLPGDMIAGTTIGCAGGSVRFITNKDQMIFASTLREGVLRYLTMVGRDKVRCFVVENEPPATSHEANTARIEGLPVICVENSTVLKTWLTQPDLKLVIDFQQGMIINWVGQQKSLEELRISDLVMDGWVNYPIPLQLSIAIPRKKPVFSIEPLIKDLGTNLKPETISAAAKRPSAQLIDELKKANQPIAKVALTALLVRLAVEEKRLKNLAEKKKLAPELLLHFNILSEVEAGCAREIATTLQLQPLDARRLYAVRFLEALMLQSQSSGTIKALSFKQLYAEIGHEWKVKTKQKIQDPISVQLAKVGSVAFTPETKQKWENFVKDLAALPEPADVTPKTSVKNRFTRMIAELNQHDLVTLWLHLSFDPEMPPQQGAAAARAEEPLIDQTRRLIAEFDQSKSFLDILAAHRQNIEQFNSSAFDNPRSFVPLTAQLRGLMAYFIDDEFIEMFQKSERLGKHAALNLMNVLVEKFDSSLKALESSPKYPPDLMENVTNFKALLDIYFVLLQKWSKLLPELPQGVLSARDVIDRIAGVFTWLDMSKPSIQIKPSQNFDVTNILIGRLGEGSLNTLYDSFTTIHQNAKMYLVILMKNLGIDKIKYPKCVEMFHEIQQLQSLELVGIEFMQQSLKFKCNRRLNAHSLMVDFTLNTQKNNWQVFCKFYGHNDKMFINRWNAIATIIRIMEHFNHLKVVDLTETYTSVNFTLNFAAKFDFVKTLNEILKLTIIVANMGKIKELDFFDQFNNKPEIAEFLVLDTDADLDDFSFMLDRFTDSTNIRARIIARLFGSNASQWNQVIQKDMQANKSVLQEFGAKLNEQFKQGNPNANKRTSLLDKRLKELNLENFLPAQ